MKSIYLRVLLTSGSLVTMIFILTRIRASKVQIKDSVFWILFSALLFLMSLFPTALFRLSNLLGIESPTNLVFLVVLFVLITHQFVLSIKLSRLEANQRILTQDIALASKEKVETEESASIKEREQN